MTAAQARLLYAAGGFPISADGKHPTNRCGKAAKPRITFVDMNGDKRKEALFVDIDACHRPDGRWYAIATQNTDGSWRPILEGPGTLRATGTQRDGWFVLDATSAGKTQRLHYNGQRYTGGVAVAATGPAKAASPAPTSAAPLSPATGEAAIFKAAGFTKQGKQWKSDCNDPGTTSYGPGTVEMKGDLNGDGRPEAVVTESGTYCYGMTGTGFWLVSQQADDSWKLMARETGIPEFLKTKGVGGWPDISVGGPGFCFPVLRWNGKAYVHHRSAYEGKPCRK